MEATSRAALTQLIVGDSIMIEGEAKHRDPLIRLLREAMTSSTGGSGSSGAGGARSLLNVAAIDLYDHIDGYTRAALAEWHRPNGGDLELALERMFDAIQAEMAVWMTPEQGERMYARFDEWVRKILDLFDPPHVKEFAGACAECGETHHVDDGVQNLALAASIRPGWAVTVECRACQMLWVGQEQLTGLAEHLGAEGVYGFETFAEWLGRKYPQN